MRTSERTPSDGGELGGLLREWRARLHRSQLELALDAGVSQRHLSFVESGRSAPSRALLAAIVRALEMPLRDGNRLFLAAGYAPAYIEDGLDADALAAVKRVLGLMLAQHEPFPALVLDRRWNVVMTNTAAPRFFNAMVDLSRWPRPRNLLALMFDPAGLQPVVANWAAASQGLLERVRRESVGHVLDAETQALLARIAPGLVNDDGVTADSPVVPLSFRTPVGVLSYFSMVTTVGTPSAVAAQELRVECMYPIDEDTEARHRAWMAGLDEGLPCT